MAKPIRMTEEMKEICLEEFRKTLNDSRMSLGTFEFKKALKYEADKKCEVCYNSKAWYKTIMLIEIQPKEVGWHGICRRDEEDPTVFYVEDILVYPQKVTAINIDPDPVEYAAWMNSLDDDTFNNLRIHVHSHVNMGTTPSSTDQTFRKDRLSQLRDDDFYVFQIMNKKGEINSAVYDFKNNIFYESADVKTVVACECEMEEWDTYKTIGKLLMACTGDELTPILALYREAGMKEFLSDAQGKVKDAVYRLNRCSSYPYGSRIKEYDQYRSNTSQGNQQSSAVNKEGPDAPDIDKRLSDPLGYTDERGVFHGSDYDEYSCDGDCYYCRDYECKSNVNFTYDDCYGDCDMCKNTQCSFNENYYDSYGGVRTMLY